MDDNTQQVLCSVNYGLQLSPSNKRQNSDFDIQGPYENTPTLTSKRSVDFIVRSRHILLLPMEYNGIQACLD